MDETSKPVYEVKTFLNQETVVMGRVRISNQDAMDVIGLEFGRSLEHYGERMNVLVGDGERLYKKNTAWLPEFEKLAVSKDATVNIEEVEMSSTHPDRDSGRLNEGEQGYYGGAIVEIQPVVIAVWTAAGGIKGITEFLKLTVELKKFWDKNRSIEITLTDGTKIKVSDEKDIDWAIATIARLKDAIPKQEAHGTDLQERLRGSGSMEDSVGQEEADRAYRS